MGYRNYIGFIPKREYNKIKKLTSEEFYKYKGITPDSDGDMYFNSRELYNELYEFGKYCDFETDKLVKPFFKNKVLQAEMDADTELYVVGKEFLKKVIESYHEKIKTYYAKMLENFDGTHIENLTQTEIYEAFRHIRSMSFEWTQLTPYDLDNGDQVTDSWKYEYNIFELVRIYKSFDWKRNVMVYYGY